MVSRAGLLAHAVGAVRQGDGPDAGLSAAGGEDRAAAAGAFLFQIQFCNNILMFHGEISFQ